jgi:putative nucleotidyltransferase with HDIG domain
MSLRDPTHLLATLPVPDPAWFVRPDGEDGSRTIHGVAHTRRVMVHAIEIAEEVGASVAEREAVLLAALWHDIGRTDDGRDYFHGAKSAGKVVGLGLHRRWPAELVEVALYAITHHSGGEPYGIAAARELPDEALALRVFQILKDADGLDRVRFDGLDVARLRLPPSRLREPRARDLLELIQE